MPRIGTGLGGGKWEIIKEIRKKAATSIEQKIVAFSNKGNWSKNLMNNNQGEIIKGKGENLDNLGNILGERGKGVGKKQEKNLFKEKKVN